LDDPLDSLQLIERHVDFRGASRKTLVNLEVPAGDRHRGPQLM